MKTKLNEFILQNNKEVALCISCNALRAFSLLYKRKLSFANMFFSTQNNVSNESKT